VDFPWPFRASRNAVTGEIAVRDLAAPAGHADLPAAEWQPVLAPGDPIVEVHVAGGSRMPPEECAESYRQALAFYPSARAFTCESWLLDAGLPRMLPPGSNIVRFLSTFHLLPMPGLEWPGLDAVFGDPRADPAKMPLTTQLRRVVAAYMAAGNHLQSGAGFMMREEVMILLDPDATSGFTFLP
jgi:hypothetical protein